MIFYFIIFIELYLFLEVHSKMHIILFCKIFRISTEDWNNLNVPGDPASTSTDKDKPPQPKTKTLKNNIIKYVGKRDRK